jgi:hypothetical protein
MAKKVDFPWRLGALAGGITSIPYLCDTPKSLKTRIKMVEML